MTCPRCGRAPATDGELVDAVIFDWFDTIAKLPGVFRSAAFDRFARGLGLDLPDGALWEAWIAKPSSAHPIEEALCGQPIFELFEDRWTKDGEVLVASHGRPGAGPDFAAMQATLHRSAPIWEDATEAVATVRETYAVAVLSDADDDFLLPSVRASALPFEIVMSSEGLVRYKPHAEVFEAICQALSVPPSRAVYVGDAPRADVAGALHAGMRAVWLNRTGRVWPTDLPPPSAVIATLAELPATLSGWG